jgi:hypothetical protein
MYMATQKLRRKKNFTPCVAFEEEEMYNLGIFQFNISRILEHLQNGKLVAKREDIDVDTWTRRNCCNNVNESHLYGVDINLPVIQAEISPGRYVIIDGNHRLEKARRNQVGFIPSYKIWAIQLVDYFTEERGYLAFIDFWNEKCRSEK